MKRCSKAVAAAILCVAMLASCADAGTIAAEFSAGTQGQAAAQSPEASEPAATQTAAESTATATAAPTASPTASADIEIINLNTRQATAKSTAKAVPAAKAKATAKTDSGSLPAMAMAAPSPDGASTIAAEARKFMVTASKYYSSYGFSSNHYAYTAAELRMLAIVIHMEARGEPYRAKIAVANVVMNRVLARGYPGSTIKEVVTRPNQFCYKASVTPNAECVRAARDVLDHEVWVLPQNVYFFRSTGSKANWGRHEYWGHIGHTAFYQDRYAGRFNGDSVPPRLFERVYKWPQYGCKPAARVRKIQIMLKGLGYKVTVDGYFGMETKKELLKFQGANGLAADGIAGPATLRVLIRKYGLSKYLKL